MRSQKHKVTGPQAASITDHDLAAAPRLSQQLPEMRGKLDETDRALWSCYADLIRETEADLHDLYENTVAELRLAYTRVAGMPNERGEEAAPGIAFEISLN